MVSSSPAPQPTSKRPIYDMIADPKATQHLPSLTSVIRELEQIAGQQNVMINEVGRVIRSDQSMAVRILRLANSAYFAPAEPILDVDQALIYLGLSQIRSSILTARCIEKTCSTSSKFMPWPDFWLHSVAVGCITKTLASYLKAAPLNQESFYIMGLFHDIGKLALAYLSPEDFELVLQLASDRKSPTSPVEIELFGLDHANLGAWYLQQQGMPPTIFEPIRFHHAWAADTNDQSMAFLINLADQFAHYLNQGRSGSLQAEKLNPFQSQEWEHYLNHCSPESADPQRHAQVVASELEKIPDLIHRLIA